MTATLLLTAALAAALPQAEAEVARSFTLGVASEAIATITAGCAKCDWSAQGREAVLLELSIDGRYSQHVVLVRGRTTAAYRVMLGRLDAGTHRLTLRQDRRRSAANAGDATIDAVDVESFAETSPEYGWLSRTPFLRARPGSMERFSDIPLLTYVETDVQGEDASPYRYQYTVVFSNEDGGTPPDRLMATWGRTTDIEFVYGVAQSIDGRSRELIQAEGHRWIDFTGPRLGTHPVLWVATENNMVADHGADDLVVFAPAPMPIALRNQSREAVMDAQPWTYAVTAGEMIREGRVDAAAPAGSGFIAEARRYATVDACADVSGAALAFDVGVRRANRTEWYATDRGEPAFRIARGGCFRGAAPLPDGIAADDIVALRIRAYARERDPSGSPTGDEHVVLRRVNSVFILGSTYQPAPSPLSEWSGELHLRLDASPVEVPFTVR